MNPRRLIVLVIAAGLLGGSAGVRAQAPQRRIAVFTPGNRGPDEFIDQPFYDEMRQLGWVEGQNIAYDRVYAGERMDQIPRLAAELVARRPDLILTISPPTSSAAKQATASIPIVFTVVVDPLAAGLVESLAHPGGNATGVTQSIAESLAPKRIQLLREVLPGVKRVGLLGNPLDPGSVADQAALAPLVDALGLTMILANGTNPDEFDASVATLVDSRVQAIVVANGIAVSRRVRMIEMTTRARIPVIGLNVPMAEAGALLSFGPSIADQLRRSAHLVDKVLRGARPADIPVEAANVLDLVVNLKTAKALGITIPQSIMLRADKVIG